MKYPLRKLIGLIVMLMPALHADLARHEFSRIGPEFLLSLKVDGTKRTEFAKYIENLGSDDFKKRQAAERSMFAAHIVPMDMLVNAEAAGNTQQKVSIHRYREHMLLQLEEPITRAFGEIRKERMPGWVEDVLYAMRYCRNDETYYVGELCLTTTVTDKDTPTLIAALKSNWHYERQLAASLLLKVPSAERLNLVAPLLEDPDQDTALHVAGLYLETGDVRGFKPMIEFLQTGTGDQRLYVQTVLKRLANEAAPDLKTTSDWRTWAAKYGQAALDAHKKDGKDVTVEADLAADFVFRKVSINRIDGRAATHRNVIPTHGLLKFSGTHGPANAMDETLHFTSDLNNLIPGKGLTLEVVFLPENDQEKGSSMSLCKLAGDAEMGTSIGKDGAIVYSFITHKTSTRLILGQRITPGKWNRLSVAVSPENSMLITKLNQGPVRQTGFDRHIEKVEDLFTRGNIRLSFDKSRINARGFQGDIRSLKVYRRAFSGDELDHRHDQDLAP